MARAEILPPMQAGQANRCLLGYTTVTVTPVGAAGFDGAVAVISAEKADSPSEFSEVMR